MQTTLAWPVINPNFERKGTTVIFLENVNGEEFVFRVECIGEIAIIHLIRTHRYEWSNRCRLYSRRPFRLGRCIGKESIANKGESLLGEWMSRYNSLITGEKRKRYKRKKIKRIKGIKI